MGQEPLPRSSGIWPENLARESGPNLPPAEGVTRIHTRGEPKFRSSTKRLCYAQVL